MWVKIRKYQVLFCYTQRKTEKTTNCSIYLKVNMVNTYSWISETIRRTNWESTLSMINKSNIYISFANFLPQKYRGAKSFISLFVLMGQNIWRQNVHRMSFRIDCRIIKTVNNFGWFDFLKHKSKQFIEIKKNPQVWTWLICDQIIREYVCVTNQINTQVNLWTLLFSS